MFSGIVLRAEPFDCGVANTMSKVTHVGLHGFAVKLTPFNVLLFRFALANLKLYFFLGLPETGVTFLQEDHTSIWPSVLSLISSKFGSWVRFISLFVDFVH